MIISSNPQERNSNPPSSITIPSPQIPKPVSINQQQVLQEFESFNIGVALSYARLFGSSKYESIFINKAKLDAQIDQKSHYYNQQISSSLNGSNGRTMSPDAFLDQNGNWISKGFWNGRLSSTFSNMPVMTSITFVGTTYTSLSGQQITIPSITFEMVLIKMRKGKNIEKTEITGRDTGSVKEYISNKDWDITITAVITASQNVSDGMTKFYQEGKYPEENMEMIDLLLNAPIAIEVDCFYINKRVNSSLGVDKTFLVIEDADISQIEGEYEAQRITLTCCTDSPLVLLTV